MQDEMLDLYTLFVFVILCIFHELFDFYLWFLATFGGMESSLYSRGSSNVQDEKLPFLELFFLYLYMWFVFVICVCDLYLLFVVVICILICELYLCICSLFSRGSSNVQDDELPLEDDWKRSGGTFTSTTITKKNWK